MEHSSRPKPQSAILVMGIALAVLIPIATTPYLGDDIFNSYINGALDWHGVGFWQWVAGLNATWLSRGRFFPGGLLEAYGLFHILPSLPVYKILQVASTLVNVWTFLVLLNALRVSRTISLLAVIVLICTFQMRVYHDGLLGFSVSMQYIAELILLSLLGLLVSVRTNSRCALGLSLVAYTIGLVSYEVTYLVCLACCAVVAFELPWRRALLVSAPYFVLSALVIGVQLYVKAHATAHFDTDYGVSLNAAALIRALSEQLFAAIPFTYFLVDPSGMFAHGATLFASVPTPVSLALFVFVAVTCWIVAGQIDRAAIDLRGIRTLVAVGLLLWLPPALLVASSARYQRELVPGLGHAPVYIEYFGVTMILMAALAFAIARWGIPGWPARLGGSLIVALGVVALYASNATVISTSIAEKAALMNVDAAMNSGLMGDIFDGADLYVDFALSANRYADGSPADPKYYYFLKSGKRLTIRYVGLLPADVHCTRDCSLAHPSYQLIEQAADEYAGFDALGTLRSIDVSHGVLTTYASSVKLFIRGVPRSAPLELRYAEHGCGARDRTVVKALPPQPSGSETVRFESPCGTIAMQTLRISGGSGS